MAVTISALQRNVAAVIRQVVASGIATDVTDRGRIVAVLAPPPSVTGLDRLRLQGASRPARSQNRAAVLAELKGVPQMGLTAALEEQRLDDR